jgi:hypothetical protein
MSRKKIFAVVAAIVLALATTAVVLAATVIIDHFTSGPQDLNGTIPGPSGGTIVITNSVTGGTILGGERDVVVTGTGATAAVSETFAFRTLTAAPGKLSISTDPDVAVQAHIEWDGVDGDPLNLNPVGLGGVDLISSTNSAIHFSVLFDDLPGIVLTFRVYSSASSWSYYAATLPGGITAAGSRVDFIIPFTSFVAGGSSGVDFANVGAITLDIDGSTVPGADFVLDNMQMDDAADYGDLPDSYGTTLVANGARHQILTGLRLGANLDAETDGVPSTTAAGDDQSQLPPNDEDGVARFPDFKWTVGPQPDNGGAINLTVSGRPLGGCPLGRRCYLRGWIDWNNDGFQPSDNIISQTLSGLPLNLDGYQFDIPSGVTFPNSFYARFRVCGGVGSTGARDCDSPTGAASTGEVEDYYWNFGPNAVTLNSLQAQPTTSPVVPVALIGVSALALIGVVFVVRRRKTA